MEGDTHNHAVKQGGEVNPERKSSMERKGIGVDLQTTGLKKIIKQQISIARCLRMDVWDKFIMGAYHFSCFFSLSISPCLGSLSHTRTSRSSHIILVLSQSLEIFLLSRL